MGCFSPYHVTETAVAVAADRAFISAQLKQFNKAVPGTNPAEKGEERMHDSNLVRTALPPITICNQRWPSFTKRQMADRTPTMMPMRTAGLV
jgi:hypothetical protein